MSVGSESMIERVARILEPQAWRALETGDTLAYQNRRTSSLRKAKAALQALMEPTEAMTHAGERAAWDDANHMPAIRAIPAAWSAMIRSAMEGE